MTLPTSDTAVSYPAGALTGTGTVQHVAPLAGGRFAVVLDRTPLHPVDTAWPDQPADTGTLRWAERTAPVVGAVTGGISDGELFLGEDLPVRTGTDGWVFVVAHLIDGPPPAVGEQVAVAVDAERRRRLSAGHTACHLASLALDGALADAWRKPVASDALGLPAFDALAIERSRIVPGGSVDTYRIGKSLRRKGFDPAALEDLDGVTERANAQLAEWVASGASVRIERETEGLSDRRSWVCELPAGAAVIPCGGTHADALSAFAAITVSLTVQPVEGGIELVMTTTVADAD